MEDQATLIELTSEIVANYISHNTVPVEQLPELIRTVNQTLSQLGQPQAAPEAEATKLSSAQIRKSIRPEGLVKLHRRPSPTRPSSATFPSTA